MTRQRFTIGIVGRDVSQNAACFEDMTRSLAEALRRLGHELVGFDGSPDPKRPADREPFAFDGKPGRLICVGGNNLSDPENKIPSDTIIFNTEQLASQRGVTAQMSNYEQCKRLLVWDYAEANIVRMREFGLTRLVHCPLGYIPTMTTITNRPDDQQDIDVLFYGAVNHRRRAIIDALNETDLRVVVLNGAYGADRDAFIARSKVVLNLHFYDDAVFEIFRVSHLLANKKCVVTEDGGCDRTLEAFAREACVVVPRDQIVSTCRMLVSAIDMASSFGERGLEVFQKLNFVENVRRALEQSR